MNEPDEVIVTISLRFPRADPKALADHVAPVVREGIAAGGKFTNISIMPYREDDDAA